MLGDAVGEPLVFATDLALDSPRAVGLAGLLRWAVAELERSDQLLTNPLTAMQAAARFTLRKEMPRCGACRRSL
jgi:hypothetical protein